MSTAGAGRALMEAVAVMDRLRSPGGCPWDAEQTHASLAPYAIEEAYEVAEVAESDDRAALLDELGDLLLQVLFHARIASERGPDDGGFDIDDVARGLVAKMVRRHPHVFAAGQDPAARLSAAEVEDRWEQVKAGERACTSAYADIPAAMPALVRAQKVVRRLERSGADVPGGAAGEMTSGPQTGAEAGAAVGAEEIGAQLWSVVVRAQRAGIDAEAALRDRLRRQEHAST